MTFLICYSNVANFINWLFWIFWGVYSLVVLILIIYFFNWSIIDQKNSISSRCTIVILHFYALQKDHHDKSSYQLSSYKVIKILLAIFPTPYISSPWLIYFVTGNLYLLISLIHFTITKFPCPLATTCLFSVSMTLFLFCYACSLVLFSRFHI